MGDEGLITYENLYEILRLEKYKKELQQLDKDFFDKVSRYLNEKKSILEGYESKDSVFANKSIIKTKKQLENINILLRELYEKREAKIVQMALFNSRTGDGLENSSIMLPQERKLYDELITLLAQMRFAVLEKIVEGKKPDIQVESEVLKNPSLKVVKFVDSVPEFVGEDMNVYGPFKAEDIGNLPVKVAEILIKNNMAKEV